MVFAVVFALAAPVFLRMRLKDHAEPHLERPPRLMHGCSPPPQGVSWSPERSISPEHLAQDVLQNPTVLVVGDLERRVHSARVQ